MSHLITKKYIEENPEILDKLKQSIFVYPTDTIYGLGCDARNEELVNRIREIKKRPTELFSVVVPNKKLVDKNCILTEESVSWLDKLPGPYTLILAVKRLFVAKNVSFDNKTIGIRILDNWFQEIVSGFDFPIISTSVNVYRKPFMTTLKNLDADIKNSVDFIIDDGDLTGRPSQLVNLVDPSSFKPELPLD